MDLPDLPDIRDVLDVLVVATKAPWPAIDGGRLLLLDTLAALTAAGHRPTLVAPVDPGRFDLARVRRELEGCCDPRLVPVAPAAAAIALWRAGTRREPLSIARHTLPAVRREVSRLLAERRFTVVHAEQLQALPQAEAARGRSVPVVLRAQNVESDLWAATARCSTGWRAAALALEARRLARWEGRAVRRAAATLALTEEDAARLRQLAGDPDCGGRVRVVRAPFPEPLPGEPAESLSGDPAVVVLGSRGWLPNEDSIAWFLGEVWPAVRAALPSARLHLFGMDTAAGGDPGVLSHPPPRDSAEAFAPGSVLAVPLRIASGVRMKVLEAWARGVPVVGTPAALAGLEAVDGRDALVAAGPEDFVRAFSRLHREPELAGALTAAGRTALRERHAPARIAAELLAVYSEIGG